MTDETNQLDQQIAENDTRLSMQAAEINQLTPGYSAPKTVRLIDDRTAKRYIQDADSITDPVKAGQMADELEEWQRGKRETSVRSLYTDLDTLGGAWNEDMQNRMAPFMVDPKQDRAGWANTRFLAARAGISVEQAASSYALLRDRYAADHFKGEPKDDISFFNAVQGQYAKVENVSKILE